MNDPRIDNLLRMVGELDELERSAGEPAAAPRVQSAGRRALSIDEARAHGRRWNLRVAAIAAVAAIAGLGVRLAVQPALKPASNDSVVMHITPPRDDMKTVAPRAGDDTETALVEPDPRPVIAAAQEYGSMILGIFEDSSGVVRCVRWREHDFGGRALEDVRPGELTAATYGQPCVVGPHKLIAVALSGPLSQLPETDEEAQAVAQCIIGTPAPICDHHLFESDHDAISCMPSSLKFRVETLAMGR